MHPSIPYRCAPAAVAAAAAAAATYRGENSETDVVLVTTLLLLAGNGEPYVYWVTRIYDLPTFLITFYSYDIDGLEGGCHYFSSSAPHV
eukprot:1150081-Pelagomonas_calceolata.AAC.2